VAEQKKVKHANTGAKPRFKDLPFIGAVSETGFFSNTFVKNTIYDNL